MQELEARASPSPMANPQFDMGLGLASSDEQLPLAAHLSYQALHMPAPMHAHFVTQDGKVLRSIVDVIFELEHMPPHIFSHHVNEQKHDFAQWIKDVYGFSEFAFCMQPIKDKNTLLTFLHTVLKTSRKYETTKR
jgi:hypothetical protein